jgi:putative Mn2+ efflux pump MntP
MGIVELILTALGLSADAFAVSVTNGLSCCNSKIKKALITGLVFGLFQGAMPTLGYFLAGAFTEYITKIDHFIAFVLLALIGGKMLLDSIKEGIKAKKQSSNISGNNSLNNSEKTAEKLKFSTLLVSGVATSIDALAVGVSFAALSINIVTSAALIAVITFVLSFVGVLIGAKCGHILGNKAQIFGGLILVGIGTKILIEHLFFA